MIQEGRISQVPKRGRKAESGFERTEDWRVMKSRIDKGLKPGAAVWATLTEDDKEQMGIMNRRTIARFVQKYLASVGKEYTVKAFHRDDMDFIVVERP